MVSILNEGNKQRDMIEEKNFRVDRFLMGVKGHMARLDALTTTVVALESKGDASTNVMAVKLDINVLKKEVV